MLIYDSVLKKKVEFVPQKAGEVSLYLCGPTVYDDAHLGHAKSSVSFDLLVRVLRANSLNVKFARNYTDIDDKILKKMNETGKSLGEITAFYIGRFESEMGALNVCEPTFKPLATQHIEAMQTLIARLLENGAAYVLGDGIYFDTSFDARYFCLSGRKDENKQARVASVETKRDEKDFVLWKFDEAWYESPWGRGRPGWHTECVAMIHAIFGGAVDIHAGGADLLFPHHENEASQCRCGFGFELSRHWMHNGFVQIDGEKMSKSLGNSFFVKDALALAHGEALRFYLMSVHYRANFNYAVEDLMSAKRRLDRLYRLKKRLLGVAPSAGSAGAKFREDVMAFLNDDLNVSGALSVVDEFITGANLRLDSEPKNRAFKGEVVANLEFVSEVFGVLCEDVGEWFAWGVDAVLREKIEALLEERNEAKAAKDYVRADALREELLGLGVVLQDTPNGVVWEVRSEC